MVARRGNMVGPLPGHPETAHGVMGVNRKALAALARARVIARTSSRLYVEAPDGVAVLATSYGPHISGGQMWCVDRWIEYRPGPSRRG